MENFLTLLVEQFCTMFGLDRFPTVVGIITSIVLIIAGLLIGIFGLHLFKKLLSIYGFCFGFSLGLSLNAWISRYTGLNVILKWIICLVPAVIFMFLLIKLVKAGIFIVSGLVGFAIAYVILPNLVPGIIGFVLFGVIGLLFAKFIAGFYFAMSGAFMASGGLVSLIRLEDTSVGGIIFITVGIVLTIVLFTIRKKDGNTDTEDA